MATLPWVEPDTITTDGKTRQVRFTVKKGTQFDLDEVKAALGPRYDGGVRALALPDK